MKRCATNDISEAQMEFSCILPPTILPNGNGGFVVTPGKPIARLTASQAAAMVGVSSCSIRRYINEGLISQHLVEAAGKRKWLIHAAGVEELKQKLLLMRQ